MKTAKVFGEDIPRFREFFDQKGIKEYQVNQEHDYLEFHVSKVRSLRKFDIEVGISSNVIENRNGDMVIRELKVDVTDAENFSTFKRCIKEHTMFHLGTTELIILSGHYLAAVWSRAN